MKTAVVSYSHTGNNDKLAVKLAQTLSAEHIRIIPEKPVTNGGILLDLLFERTPSVQPNPDALSGYDFIVFIAPVWMGMVAFPLRAHLHRLKNTPVPYGFVCISGGADGSNPRLETELKKRTGLRPAVLLDMHIRDLLVNNPRPERKDTAAYRITDGDVTHMAATATDLLTRSMVAGS